MINYSRVRTKRISNRGLVLLFVSCCLATLHSACSTVAPRSGVSNRSAIGSAGPGVKLQEKKTFAFDRQQIYFSNEFNSARLNGVSSINDSTFRVRIEPENTPINRSPWFAFKVWSERPRAIHLILDYGDVRHRYVPKHLNRPGGEWKEVSEISLNESRTQARFRIPIGPDTSWVSGQPIFNKDSIVNWLQELGKKPYVQMQEIGESTLGQPIFGYQTPAVENKKAIVILGGQHPPEFTGFQAQVAFVNFLLGNDPLAQRFRSEYQIVGVPWINPDGNNLGHWRHNVNGVDLNRDWTTFVQKETTAARDYLLELTEDRGVKFVFGVDFHTTFRDILYTNNPDPDYQTHQPGLMDRWIAGWNAMLGDHTVPVRPSDAAGRISKSWMMTELKAEAVTYEVADTTPLDEICYKAERAAMALIKTLLDE